jgi:hypothetical protein
MTSGWGHAVPTQVRGNPLGCAWRVRLNNKVVARVRELEAQVTQSWMAFGTSPEYPVVFAFGLQNGDVVD